MDAIGLSLTMIASILLNLFTILILTSYMQDFLRIHQQQVPETKLGIVNSVGIF
jgi:hypothetical protein